VYLVFPPRYHGAGAAPAATSGRSRAAGGGGYPVGVAGRREDLGSWLEGTPGGEPDDSGLGLPSTGRGARAGLGRRVVGVAVDWLASLAVSAALFPEPEPVTGGILAGRPLATLGVFAVSTVVLVGLLGTTIGHRLAGIRVVRLRDVTRDGAGTAEGGRVGPPGLVAGLVRTGLLCLVVPAVVWDSDGRGLHDAAAGTVVVRG